MNSERTARAGFLRHSRAGVLLVVVALAGTLVVPLFLGGEAAMRAALHLSAEGYLALLATITVSWIARTLKLQFLLKRMGADIGFLHMFEISLATDFGFLATPAGLGGYAASVYYIRRAGAPMGVAAALTAADQGLDLMFFALALPLAGFAFFGADLPPSLMGAAAATFATLAALALVALIARRRWTRWPSVMDKLGRRWPVLQRLERSFTEFCTHMRAQLRMLAGGGPGFIGSVFALTVLQWITRYGILWLVLLLLGYHVSFWLLLALQGLVLHVAQWSGIPAGGGGAELGLGATLTTWVPAASLATALLLWRMVTLYLALVVGSIAIARLARRRETGIAALS